MELEETMRTMELEETMRTMELEKAIYQTTNTQMFFKMTVILLEERFLMKTKSLMKILEKMGEM